MTKRKPEQRMSKNHIISLEMDEKINLSQFDPNKVKQGQEFILSKTKALNNPELVDINLFNETL